MSVLRSHPGGNLPYWSSKDEYCLLAEPEPADSPLAVEIGAPADEPLDPVLFLEDVEAEIGGAREFGTEFEVGPDPEPLVAEEPAADREWEITTMILPDTAKFSLDFLRSLVIVSSELDNRRSMTSPIRTLTTPRKPWSFFLNFFWSNTWITRMESSSAVKLNDSFQ